MVATNFASSHRPAPLRLAKNAISGINQNFGDGLRGKCGRQEGDDMGRQHHGSAHGQEAAVAAWRAYVGSATLILNPAKENG